jgi:guanylate kinase
LRAALDRFGGDLWGRLAKLVLYDSRGPRPGERDGVDYHFRRREQIEALRGCEGMSVFEVRGDLQAMDRRELAGMLEASDVLFEGNPFIGGDLLDWAKSHERSCLSVFLSPLARDEVAALTKEPGCVCLGDLLTEMMRRKLLRRTERQKGGVSLADLENIEIRAGSAYEELKQAWRFDYVIPNHDGEDSEHWDAFYYPVGDARKALLAFTDLLAGRSSAYVEKWERDLIR